MKAGVVRKRPLARLDLADCYAYIGERNPDAARRFRQAAESSFETLAKVPGLGAPYEVANARLAGLRFSQVKRFKNYLIFYVPIEGGIDVIRVLHAARNIQAILDEQAE